MPTAQQANALAAAEPWHEVGSVGQPQFGPDCQEPSGDDQTVGFFKDHEDIVHLKGIFTCSVFEPAFVLPPGDRPTSGKLLGFPPGALNSTDVLIYGDSNGSPAYDGAVACQASPMVCSLDGITFRAES